ncbi:GNAT family N-acetyltransferase [Candidatus Kapaibacterium sp.]
MKITIRNMELPELEIATYLAYKEGWNPGIADGLAFYQQDPCGFFLAEIDGRVVGCISAVKYSDNYGFIGFYVVDEEYRNSPAGTLLARKALKYLQGYNIGIDGVLSRVSNYERIGFRYAHNNARYEGIGGKYNYSQNIVLAATIPVNEICDYDRLCFPALRTKFIDAWINLPNSKTFCYVEKNKLMGYGTIRQCRKGYKIGPLFADNEIIANELFKALSGIAVDELIYLDVSLINKVAVKLADRYEMKKVFETIRMYTISQPDIQMEKVFGITSFELG